MLTLYSGPLSLFARKTEIALGEKGLKFERVMVPFTQATGYAPKDPVVLAANPKGQVPVLVDGDLALFDSTVILEYLEDAYPEPPLYPRSAPAKARCRLLELHADEILLPPVRALMHRSAPPDADPQRTAERERQAATGETEIAAQYATLQAKLGGQTFFCGDFSAADIALYVTILYALRHKGPRLDAVPTLAAWHRRVGERPAVAGVTAEIHAADRALSPDLFR
jgi:glutathione S-transferase